MLEINDTVVYGTTGVCKVEGIEEKRMGREVKKYYVLRPAAQSRAAVYLPADNDLLLERIRPVIRSEQAAELLDSVGKLNGSWIDSEDERMSFCRSALKSNNIKDRLTVIAIMRRQRAVLAAENKHLHRCRRKGFERG